MQINCTICFENYHYTWARDWDKNAHCYRDIPFDQFVCLKCRVGGKK